MPRFIVSVLLSLIGAATLVDATPVASVGLPQRVVLELSDARFASIDDSFRVQLALSSSDSIPLRIWLESKQTKVQWASLVTDIKHHSSRDANYVLPVEAIVACLKQGLSALTSAENIEANGCHVTLKESDTMVSKLVLTMKAFSQLSAVYEFKLEPVIIEKIDALETKIRDLQDQVPLALNELEIKIQESSLKLNGPTYLSLKSTSVTEVEKCFTWEIHSKETNNQIKLLADKNMILFQIPGIYIIQVRGITQSCDTLSAIQQNQLRLLIDKTKTWLSFPSFYDGTKCVSQLTYTINAINTTMIQVFSVQQWQSVHPDTTMTIMYLEK
ncbi:Aste57867_607 [Aphanomyces stellatus]|uniref:Aste57867_607 protein n=1 Tax=Aphanomyces stellatus TaxID=120398 RepID=A0A485K310_9STRA|nr:hypothetical protein As57867_000606 [Aphanomyces stellatus]VFT77832.1 Aste57867_607 [Aphanomyces stellatus]